MSDRRDGAADCSVPDGAELARVGLCSIALSRCSAIVDWGSQLRKVRHALGHNFVLAFHAGNLALATIANGALGFVYWWVLARAFTPANVGLGSADISVLILLS